MKLNTGTLIYNTETCSHTRKVRITKEELTSRSYVVKTEQLCHQIHCKEHYFLIVDLEKYTDNQLTSTYSWIQTLDPDELQEFLDLPDYYKPRKPKPPKPPKPPKEPKPKKESTFDRKAYKKEWEEQNKDTIKEKRHQYYEAHKEEIKQRTKEYFKTHKDKKNENSRKYYEEHKDKWQQYYINKKEK